VAPLELNEVVYTFAVGHRDRRLPPARGGDARLGDLRASSAPGRHIIALRTVHWLLGKFGLKLRPLRSRALRSCRSSRRCTCRPRRWSCA